MTAIDRNQAPRQASRPTTARVEKRCDRCEPPSDRLRVRAVSVTNTVRCDHCHGRLWPGRSYWAVFLPDEEQEDQLDESRNRRSRRPA